MSCEGESVLMNLPHHLLVDIVRKAGEIGFEELRQVMASCRKGMALVKNKMVLKAASLKMLEENPELINMGSPYMVLFMSCFKAMNESAIFLESLRLVAQQRYIEDTCDWIRSVGEETLEMEFARGMFEITIGDCFAGKQTLNEFKENAGSLEKAEEVADKVFEKGRCPFRSS